MACRGSSCSQNAEDEDKETPLHWAQSCDYASPPSPPDAVAHYNDDPDAVKVLLAHGADINAHDKGKRAPLLLAASNYQIDSAKCQLPTILQ